MKYLSLNFSKIFPLLATISVLFTACDKVKTTEPLNGAGQTLVKILNGGTATAPGLNQFSLPFINTPQTIDAVSIRRDVANNAALNQTLHVVVQDDVALLAQLRPDLIPLPRAWYTIGAETPLSGVGGTYAVTFKPGEFAKPIQITIPNTTLLDPTKKYGLAFTIMSVDANGIVSATRTTIVQINAKNDYEGLYVSNGYFYHPSGPRSIDALQKFLSTAGPNSVIMDLGDIGSLNYRALITINPNNTLTIVTAPGASGGPYTMYTSGLPTTNPGYTTAAEGHSGPSNYYDPVTKTFYLRYGYLGGSGWRVTEEIVTRL